METSIALRDVCGDRAGRSKQLTTEAVFFFSWQNGQGASSIITKKILLITNNLHPITSGLSSQYADFGGKNTCQKVFIVICRSSQMDQCAM